MGTLRVAAGFVLLAASLPAGATEASATALDRARSHHIDGAWEAALAAYTEVTETGEPLERATAFNNACVIQNTLGRYQEALELCRQSLALRRELDDDLRLGRTLNNLALARQYLGDYEQAEEVFQEALAINRRLDDPQGQAINLANIGVVATQAGRYRQALEAYQAVEELVAADPEAGWAPEQLRFARLNTGVVYERLGAYREALELYRELLDQQAELPAHFRALLLGNVGVIYRNLGDPIRAREEIGAAAEAFRDVGDRAGEANALLNLALVHHLNLEEPERAEVLYRRALELAVESGDRAEVVRTRFYLGHLLADQQQTEEARALFERALEESRRSGSAEGTWSALSGLARIARIDGRPRDALERLDEAMAAIEAVRESLDQDRLRIGFFGDKRPVYAAAVGAWSELHAAGDPEAARRALEIVQRAKARDLLDALGVEPWQSPTVETGVLADRLGSNVLVEYFVGERLYAWTIRAGEVTMVDLGDPAPIFAAVRATYRALAGGHQPDPAQLSNLANRLLGWADLPWESLGELRVAPDGLLALLPFELLPLADGSPIVERVAVSYLPSASTLVEIQPRPLAPRWRLVGLGAPELPDPDVGSDPAALLVSRFRLAPLPGAERELRAIGDRFPDPERRIGVGPEATEAAFRAAAVEGSRVLHFATHTVIDTARRGGSAILLTAQGDDDGLLQPAEIAATELATDLTILASCRSALTEDGGPPALTSLVGAFLAAGSAGVLATLWEVDDATTAVVMPLLYDRLAAGERPVDALRAVKNRLRDDPAWNDPSVWAAYVLVGNPPPVVDNTPVPRWIGAALAVVLVVLLVTLWPAKGRP